ncbi:MAG: hypothetical protein IT244_01835 [Bacteroidia bacterium]|nr:hypothetical protein [Bacteroidia bacterium]
MCFKIQAQGLIEFIGEEQDKVHLSLGLHVGNVQNKLFNSFIESYNTVNKTTLKRDFRPYKFLSGYELGIRWTIMELGLGSYGGFRQRREISPIAERVMDIKIQYVNALASFPIAKKKLMMSLGLQTIKSVFSAYIIYNNGERSFGKEYNLNGNYKGLGMNYIARLEGYVYRNESHALGIYGNYTGVIKGTGGIWIDNNAAKNALNLGNSVTSTSVKTEFRGFVLGVHYHYTLGE